MGLEQNKTNFIEGKAAFEAAASDVRNKGFVVARIDKLVLDMEEQSIKILDHLQELESK